MTHPALRRSEPYAECRGNSTHSYEQNGIGYDQDGKALGRIDYANNRLIPFSKRGRPPKASVPEAGLQAGLEVPSPDPDADPDPAEPEVQPEAEPEAEPAEIEPVDVDGNFIIARAAVKKITGVHAKNMDQLLQLIAEYDIPVAKASAEGDG